MNGLQKIRIALANDQDRSVIYKIRHDVYAKELGQHQLNPVGELSDALDDYNTYIIASNDISEIMGFISITPPGHKYSLDKYVSRNILPFDINHTVYEARILTVRESFRGSAVAMLLMYAALRWVESHGGTQVVGMGRSEIAEIYKKTGFRFYDHLIKSGNVSYEIMSLEIADAQEQLKRFEKLLDKLEGNVDWRLGISFQKPTASFHGGAFFDAIGKEFNQLEASEKIINADVLDAWFPPSPKVTKAINEYLPWLLRTSPPTNCEGMIQTVARIRNIRRECVLVGAGSSDLIFLAMRSWLNSSSRVLILDPCYGEYAHIFERIIRCHVDRIYLPRADGYQFDEKLLSSYLKQDHDLIVIVNPNSPTGRHVARAELESILGKIPVNTRVWVDETYVEYAGADQSVEQFAVQCENVVVCKSMSKVYALSGARAAYLVSSPHLLEDLRSITPPWAVSLLGQVAAVNALQDSEYYLERYRETHILRDEFILNLRNLNAGLEIIPSTANFILCHLPESNQRAKDLVQKCKEKGLFLRDASSMGTNLGDFAVRIAVKDSHTNYKMIQILEQTLE